MKWWLLNLIAFGFSSFVLSANFHVSNQSFSGTVVLDSMSESPRVVKNFRVRMVAERLFLKSVEQIVDYVTAYQQDMEKALVPALLTESNLAHIFAHQAAGPSHQFTIIVSADLCEPNQDTKKWVGHAHYVSERSIGIKDLLIINLRSIAITDQGLSIDFTAMIDTDDGQGFMSITFNRF